MQPSSPVKRYMEDSTISHMVETPNDTNFPIKNEEGILNLFDCFGAPCLRNPTADKLVTDWGLFLSGGPKRKDSSIKKKDGKLGNSYIFYLLFIIYLKMN